MKSIKEILNDNNITEIEKIEYLIDYIIEELIKEHKTNIKINLITKNNYQFSDINYGRIYEKLDTSNIDKIKQNILLSIELIIKKIFFEITLGRYTELSKELKPNIEIYYNKRLYNHSKNIYGEIINTIYHEFYHHIYYKHKLEDPNLKILDKLEEEIIHGGNIIESATAYENLLSELSAETYSIIKTYEFIKNNKLNISTKYIKEKEEEFKIKLINYDVAIFMNKITPKLVIKLLEEKDGTSKYFKSFIDEKENYNDPITIITENRKKGIVDNITYYFIGSKNYIKHIISSKMTLSEEMINLILTSIEFQKKEYLDKQNHNLKYSLNYTFVSEYLEYNNKRLLELEKLKKSFIKYITKPKVKKRKN